MTARSSTGGKRVSRPFLHLFLRLQLAAIEWRIRRTATALERLHGLPPGWLLVERNTERWQAWQGSRARWHAAMQGRAP